MEKLSSVPKALLEQLTMSLFQCDSQKMKITDWKAVFAESVTSGFSFGVSKRYEWNINRNEAEMGKI